MVREAEDVLRRETSANVVFPLHVPGVLPREDARPFGGNGLVQVRGWP